MSDKELSYKTAGVDIDAANDTKSAMGSILDSADARVMNKVGAFATLFDGSFPDLKHPVLVFKTEEPGTKQKLALQNDSVETICHDLINHLVNDAIVMGAKPLSIQDCIVCGKMQKETVLRIVSAMSAACKENECVLTGGETSEQPGVVEEGTYILTASIVGVVDKDKIIDGSKIQEGDVVLALPSSGIHTNGFSLVRSIMREFPNVLNEVVEGQSFMKTILTPHRGYYQSLKGLFGGEGLVGMAHITGGGIKENLNRVLPSNLNAEVDLSSIEILPVFKTLKRVGGLKDADMVRTFNMGVGMAVVVRPQFADQAIEHFKQFEMSAYGIGVITKGEKQVVLKGDMRWN